MMKITILDIAKACGVSKTAVSLALNGKQTSIGISSLTLERIQKAAQEMGYKRDEAASNLGRRNVKKARVAILAPWSGAGESFFMSEVLRAAASLQGRMRFEHLLFEPGGIRSLSESKRLKSYDRVFICGTSSAEDSYLETHADANKTIMLNRNVKGLACFSCDNFAGGRLLGEHCLSSGVYKNFIYLAHKGRSFAILERIRGIKAALSKAGMDLEVAGLEDDPLPKLLEIKASGKPAALFLPLDHAAAKAVSLLLREGAAVPSEIGVCGFDREPISELMSPRITTIDSGIFQMAKEAFESAESEQIEACLHLSAPILVPGGSTIKECLSTIKNKDA